LRGNKDFVRLDQRNIIIRLPGGLFINQPAATGLIIPDNYFLLTRVIHFLYFMADPGF